MRYYNLAREIHIQMSILNVGGQVTIELPPNVFYDALQEMPIGSYQVSELLSKDRTSWFKVYGVKFLMQEKMPCTIPDAKNS